MRAYIAAPLFSDGERQYNFQIEAALDRLGLDTYLPQRAAISFGTLGSPRPNTEHIVTPDQIFFRDINAIRESDFFVIVLDGRVPDEGSCVELGMAYVWKKICLGIQTDMRTFTKDSSLNLMVSGALRDPVARSVEELTRLVRSYLNRNSS